MGRHKHSKTKSHKSGRKNKSAGSSSREKTRSSLEDEVRSATASRDQLSASANHSSVYSKKDQSFVGVDTKSDESCASSPGNIVSKSRKKSKKNRKKRSRSNSSSIETRTVKQEEEEQELTLEEHPRKKRRRCPLTEEAEDDARSSTKHEYSKSEVKYSKSCSSEHLSRGYNSSKYSKNSGRLRNDHAREDRGGTKPCHSRFESKQEYDERCEPKYRKSNDQQINEFATRENVSNSALQRDPEKSSDSEEEILFDWETHKRELNQLFFQDHDAISRGSEEYEDFFKFLRKYQGIQKQKILQKVIAKEGKKQTSDNLTSNTPQYSAMYELPTNFNSRYLINFTSKGDAIDTIMRRLPPLDIDDMKKNTRLSRKKVQEFKNIILLYLNFVQKQKFEKLTKLRSGQKELPIALYRQQIVDTVAGNSIVLVAGDTGCGKSTQVRLVILLIFLFSRNSQNHFCIFLCKCLLL